MTRSHLATATLLLIVAGSGLVTGSVAQTTTDTTLVVGSKLFTEAIVLGEIATLAGRSAGFDVVHRRQLGGTRVLWNALVSGEIDVYAEYTGTLYREILQRRYTSALPVLLSDSLGIEMTRPLGFNNTYAIGMLRRVADSLGIERISDLADHPKFMLGFSNEFLDRSDGWPLLKSSYGLPQSARGLDHDLAYRGLSSGSIQVMDLYSTDAEIAYYDLKVLADDKSIFPRYDAIYLYRSDLGRRTPGFVDLLEGFAGLLPESLMVSMNRRVKIDGEPETVVAADFLNDAGVEARAGLVRTRASRVLLRTREHLVLVAISLTLAILAAIPLGVLAAKRPGVGAWILGAVGIIYTIPSLALLAFMIPLLGIGGPPAVVALFLYSLLPVVRNTHAGLTGISPTLTESADALGLSARDKLRHIELPLASGSIVAGIKTAAVINVGTATLGALIGAGGYGQPILTGIRLDDVGLILEGAIPAAVLALLVQAAFDVGATAWRTVRARK